MYEALGAAAGAGAGGILGQLGDAMSAPRRMAWRMLGLPEEGNELISNLTGWDKESALVKALGMGTEMVADPLNLVGAGLGALTGGGVRAAKNFNKMDSLMDEIPLANQAMAGLDSAADAQRLSDFTEESFRRAGEASRSGANMVRRADIPHLPSEDELAFIKQRAQMPGSGLTPEGMKQYQNFTPEASRLVEQMGLGGVTPEGVLETAAYVRNDPKAFKLIPPPVVKVGGNQLQAVPGVSTRRPYDTPFNSMERAVPEQPYIPEGLAGMPESAAEARLRMQSADIGADKQRIMQVLQEMNDPDKIGLIEELFRSGPNSPLGQALLAGTAAGGSMYFGSKMMGE